MKNQTMTLIRLYQQAEKLELALRQQKAFVTMAANFDPTPLPAGEDDNSYELALLTRKKERLFNLSTQEKMRVDIAIAGISADIDCAKQFKKDLE